MSPFKRPPTIVEAMESESIWSRGSKTARSFAAWRAFLKTMFAAAARQGRACHVPAMHRPIDASSRGLHRRNAHLRQARQARASFSRLFAAYLATFRDWSDCLVPGERGFITVIAADKKQAGSIFRYLRAMLSVPVFDGLIERETQETIDLANIGSRSRS